MTSKLRLVYILFFFALLSINLSAQQEAIDSLSALIAKSKDDSTKVNLLVDLGKQLRYTDLEKAMKCGEQAEKLSKKIGHVRGTATSLGLIGVVYYFHGKYADALMQWKKSEAAYNLIGDTVGVANILSNMGAIYHNQSEYSKAVELYLRSLLLAEKIKDTLRIATVLQNIGSVHLEKGDLDLALESYMKSIPMFEAKRNSEGMGLAYLNIGAVYNDKLDRNQALFSLGKAMAFLRNTQYYPTVLRTIGSLLVGSDQVSDGMSYLDSAYQVASKSGDQFELIRIINAMAEAQESAGMYDQALVTFEKAKTLLIDEGRTDMELRISAQGLVRLYGLKKDYKRAFENQQLLQSINDSIYSLESLKKIDQLLFNFEIEKKEAEIDLLSKEQELQRVEVKRQMIIRNGFIGGFTIVLIFAAIFLLQRNKIGKEKKRSEELLLNILPEETAKELKETGRSDAQLINQVTVLFTDFKGFTAMSEQLTPKDLVKDLHECFSQFDLLCETYGIEKIKTIGDAYMAAGGLPTPNDTHASDVVKAALKMRDFVEAGKARKIEAGLPYFEIRIGIHTGPVVAGIVGVKKFQYDIWGDTVNTASRMESAAEVGKVNISQSTFEILKDDAQFTFESRGKIEAKGKGEMEMYFVLLKQSEFADGTSNEN